MCPANGPCRRRLITNERSKNVCTKSFPPDSGSRGRLWWAFRWGATLRMPKHYAVDREFRWIAGQRSGRSASHCIPSPMLYTEPYGSVSPSPLRCLVRRAFGRHPPRRSGATRACGRFDHSPCRPVSHDPYGHEETCRRVGASRARQHGEGWARADLQARAARTGRRGGMDRELSPTLGRALRRVGHCCRGIETEGENKMNVSRESEATHTKVERKSECELVVTRTVNAPARLVFEAWTKAELFRKWWVPKSYGPNLLSCEMDVRVGGQYRLVFRHEDSTMEFFGTYLEVTPHSRLVWTSEEGDNGKTVTTVTFSENAGQTLLVMHDLYPSKEALDCGSTGAMPEALDQLDELLASLGSSTETK